MGPLQHMTDAGLGLMPAFDKLATSLIGDNPALTEALRYLFSAKGNFVTIIRYALRLMLLTLPH